MCLINCPGVNITVIDFDSPIGIVYMIPKNDNTVFVGGTYEDVKLTKEDQKLLNSKTYNDSINREAVYDKILNNAYKLYPPLKKGVVVDKWTGLRPVR